MTDQTAARAIRARPSDTGLRQLHPAVGPRSPRSLPSAGSPQRAEAHGESDGYTWQWLRLRRVRRDPRHGSMSDRRHPGNELWSPGTVPGESRDRLWCVTVLSGGDDERNWSQRYKANLEKLASGDLVQIVEVVRDLAGREASRGVSLKADHAQ